MSNSSLLVKKILETSNRAIQIKSLLPIATKTIDHESNDGALYQVRIAVGGYLKTSNLEREIEKEQAESNNKKKESSPSSSSSTTTDLSKTSSSTAQDPFRPIDETLLVKHIEPYHTVVLNKFMVIPEHLLIVTKEFEPQTDNLSVGDFESIVNTFNELSQQNDDYICFYNRGLYSGASQPHKHVQIVPKRERNEQLEWSEKEQFPLPKQFDTYVNESGNALRECSDFPFVHQIRSIKDCFEKSDSKEIVNSLIDVYSSMLKELDVYDEKQASEEEERFMDVQCLEGEFKKINLSTKKYPSYNLLFSKKWMLVVPRRNENFMGISCNSLAFLHGFFCKTDEYWERLKTEIQIPRLLAHVTFPKTDQVK